MSAAPRHRRCCRGRTACAIRLIDSPVSPVVPVGWRVAPLRCGPSTRWLAWDDRTLRVAIVIEVAGPDLCAALWSCDYERVVASATFEVWAAARP